MSIAELGRRAPPALLPVLRMLGDLKRIRSSGRDGSIAARLFASAWADVAAGVAVADVARRIVFDALAATQLGDLDADALQAAGIPPDEIRRIRVEAAAAAAAPLDPGLRDWLLPVPAGMAGGSPPAFVARLAAQPRAGATCPGRGRLVLEPPEDHAEHCGIVAIGAVILSPVWGARAETVFLAGLAHHLHNALLQMRASPVRCCWGSGCCPPWRAPPASRSTNSPPRRGPPSRPPA